MTHFIVVYDPMKGKERDILESLERWEARRLIRGCWVLQTNSTAELTRRALVNAGGDDIHCVIAELKPRGDHAEMGADVLGRSVLQFFGERSAGLQPPTSPASPPEPSPSIQPL